MNYSAPKGLAFTGGALMIGGTAVSMPVVALIAAGVLLLGIAIVRLARRARKSPVW